MIEVGSRVRVIRQGAGCCGVLNQGWEGEVVDMYPVFGLHEVEEYNVIVILEDLSLYWIDQVEEVT